MPFASEKQRRYMYVKHPGIAKRWSAEEKKDNPVALTVAEKKRLIRNRGKRAAALRGTAQTTMTVAQKRAAKIAKLEAGRRAGAKARAARGPATTQAQLRARQKGKPSSSPKLGPSDNILGPGFTALEEALRKKP